MGMLEWLIQGRWNTGSDIWQISFAEPINYLQLMTKGHNQNFLAAIHDTRPTYFLCFSHNLRYFQQSNSKINSGSVLYLVPSSPEPNWFTIAQCFYFLGKACCRSSTQVIQFQNKKAVKFRLTNTINISDIQILTKTCLGGVITTRTFGSSLPLTILPGVPLLLGFH